MVVSGRLNFMDSPACGEVSANAYMVERGKPAAMIAVQERYAEEAVSFIEDTFALKTHIENLANGWITLWIYKYKHILDVIKMAPQAPQTVTDHWILGKLFGYEESAIDGFISSKFS